MHILEELIFYTQPRCLSLKWCICMALRTLFFPVSNHHTRDAGCRKAIAGSEVLPAFLAAYIARSAAAQSWSPSEPASGYNAKPMLTPIRTSLLSSTIGSRSAASSDENKALAASPEGT